MQKANLAEMHTTLVQDYATKMAEYKDSALFAYVTGAFDAITKRGDNPEDFELLFITGELEQDDTNTYHINQRIRVRRFQ